MSEQKKIVLDNFDFNINCDDDKLILQVKNTVTLDEYYINFEDNDEVKKIAIFIHDISILKTFLLEQFDEYTKDDEHKTTDIIMSIEETRQNLILHFVTNEHVKYMKTSFNIILNKCAVSFDEYIKNTFTILNDTIKKLDDRVNFLENENQKLIELSKCVQDTELKIGNNIIIRGCVIPYDTQYIGVADGIDCNGKQVEKSIIINSGKFGDMIVNSTQNELQALSKLKKLTSIQISNNDNITSLDFLSDSDQLSSIRIFNCNNLVDVSALSNKQHIVDIGLFNCRNILNISSLANISTLKDLVISGTSVTEYTVFRNNTGLTIRDGYYSNSKKLK